jgi:hypothetical protein
MTEGATCGFALASHTTRNPSIRASKQRVDEEDASVMRTAHTARIYHTHPNWITDVERHSREIHLLQQKFNSRL